MTKSSSINSRSSRILLGLSAAAVLLVVIAGPGTAGSNQQVDSNCPSTCIDAGGTFGPTIPVSINEESADRFAAIIDGEAARTGRTTMNLMAVDEGTAVEVLSSNDRTAQVRLPAGQIGYVPVAWVTSA